MCRFAVALLAFALFAAPLAAEAQQAGRVARVGMLQPLAREHPEMRAIMDSLRQGLHERGYVEGRNIAIEYRGGSLEQFPELAAELVRLKVDLILVGSTTAAMAAKQATNKRGHRPRQSSAGSQRGTGGGRMEGECQA